MKIDYFKLKAESYETVPSRVKNVDDIANSIIKNVDLEKAKHLMDFGSGTGLLLERIAPYVDKITAVDVSESMNRELKTKQDSLPCELTLLPVDLTQHKLTEQYDGIISSMTMHHIKDVQSMFNKFYSLVQNDGFIAIADLDKEDGSFHTEDTGVFHHGFNSEELEHYAKQAGFKNVKVIIASIAHKPQGDFPVLLLTAKK